MLSVTTERLAWLNQPTRRRILEAAEQHFAAGGYDATRVDDIADTAKLSKSNLYYHFASKAELLTGLIDLRTAELLAGKETIYAGLTLQTLDGDPDELAATQSRIFSTTLRPRRRFIRIVLIEVLKNTTAFAPVFAAFDSMLDDTVQRFRDLGVAVDSPRAKAMLFHFGLVPALFAVALERPPFGPDLDDPDFALDLAVVEQGLIRTLMKEGHDEEPHQ